MSPDFGGNCDILHLIFTGKIFVGVCTKQACSHTSSLQHHSASFIILCCDTLPSSKRLQLLLFGCYTFFCFFCHIAILISSFQLIVQPYNISSQFWAVYIYTWVIIECLMIWCLMHVLSHYDMIFYEVATELVDLLWNMRILWAEWSWCLLRNYSLKTRRYEKQVKQRK